MSVFEIRLINATPRTIIVPTHYPTISEAIKFAKDGDTVYVLNGTYKEDYIQVDKSIKLIGENKFSTIIEGNVVLIGNNTELKHFNITKIFPKHFGGYAVLLHKASNVIIEDNIIQCNSGAGIYFQTDPGPPPKNITIRENYILWSNISWWEGILAFGIEIGFQGGELSSDVKILNNKIYGWPGYAIYIFSYGKNEIVNNTIVGPNGIIFNFPEGGNIFRGNVINVTGYGSPFNILSETLDGFIQDIDTSNLVNGRPVYYLINQSNAIIEHEVYPTPGFFGLINSRNVILQNLDISADSLLAYATNITIKGVRNNRSIRFIKCRDIIILNSSLFDVGVGRSENILIEENEFKHGIFLSDSAFCQIRGNIVKNGWGISCFSSINVEIARNNITNNTCGISLSAGVNITVYGNFINENNVGIFLSGYLNNSIFLNNFIGNKEQLQIDPYGSYANVYFDNRYEGNYWGDYNGTDDNRDGIGDTNIPHQKVDWLPLLGMVRFIKIEYGGDLYDLYIISNSTSVDVWLNETLKTLNFVVSGPFNTIGFCRLKLPKEVGFDLLNNYTILINENEPLYVKGWEVNEFAFVYFEYEHAKDADSPLILEVKRQPYEDVEPGQTVKILVNATDLLSGVGDVILSYNINNSPTWTNITMILNATTGLYEVTIPGQQAGNIVKYKIIAYDIAGNYKIEDNDGQFYTYTVIPEFSSTLILALFMLTTLIATVLWKTKRKHRFP